MRKALFTALIAASAVFAGAASAAIITHDANEAIPPLSYTPPFSALTDAVGGAFINAGADYSFGNVEGIFNDGSNVAAICGINGSNICDLVTAVDARVVVQGTTAQGLTSYVLVEAGHAALGSLTLEVFDKNFSLLDSTTLTSVFGPNGRGTMSIDRGGVFDIAYYRVSGNDSWGLNYVELEAPIRAIADVPEPASLALLGAGLVGLGFARRKKAA